MLTLLLVGLGGAAGSLARYRVSLYVHARTPHDFPWATLFVNVTGSFALGLFLPGLAEQTGLTHARGFATVGFLGAFTTFSGFAWETVSMLTPDRRRGAALYVAASLLLGVAALFSGVRLAGALA